LSDIGHLDPDRPVALDQQHELALRVAKAQARAELGAKVVGLLSLIAILATLVVLARGWPA
jgi:hypothetical protein